LTPNSKSRAQEQKNALQLGPYSGTNSKGAPKSPLPTPSPAGGRGSPYSVGFCFFLPALAFFLTHADSSHTAPSSRRLQTSEGDASSPDSDAPHLNQLEGDATGPSTTGIEQSCPHRRRWPAVSGDTTGSSHPRDLHPSAFKTVICCHHIGFSHQRIDSGPLVCPHRISGSHRRR
jgi:hypothetical protein